MEMQFFLNLDWRRNRYRRLYGLWCNPFSGWRTECQSRDIAHSALAAGIPKSKLSHYVSMLGLSREVINILQKNTKPGKKYSVLVTESGLTSRAVDKSGADSGPQELPSN